MFARPRIRERGWSAPDIETLQHRARLRGRSSLEAFNRELGFAPGVDDAIVRDYFTDNPTYNVSLNRVADRLDEPIYSPEFSEMIRGALRMDDD